MQQILEQITQLRIPIKLNGFINGKTVLNGELPDNFAGDAMLQVGEDDLHILQQKTTDLQ